MGAAADLLALPKTAAAILRNLLTSAISDGIKVTAWGRGNPTRAVYRSQAVFGVELVGAVGDIADQGFISTASGEGATINAKEVYGITRPGATFATTTLLIDNTSGGSYPYSPDNPLILTSSVTKKLYISQGEGEIAPLTNGQPLPVAAQEAGSASTSLPGVSEIDEWVTPTDGLVINQPNAANGEDAMLDPDLQAACGARVGFVPTASTIGAGGAEGAYESVARTGPDGKGGVVRPDGTRITVTRVRVEPDGSGGVIVYVADEDGPITAPDLALVEAAILAYARPKGVPCLVQNAAALPISCTLTVWIGASTTSTDQEVKDAIIAAIVDYLQGVQIGGFDLGSGGVIPLRGGLEEAAVGEAPTTDSAGSGAKSVSKLIKLVFATPSGDTTVAVNEVGVLSGTPTITVTRVSGA
jgi:hypothetical protein